RPYSGMRCRFSPHQHVRVLTSLLYMEGQRKRRPWQVPVSARLPPTEPHLNPAQAVFRGKEKAPRFTTERFFQDSETDVSARLPAVSGR
ncbi:MAG: hypothetical protein ACRYGL_10855, partial [Janthinobacterium lividum]